MHSRIHIFLLMVLLIFFMSNIQAEESSQIVELTEEYVLELLNLGDSSILGVEENRVYLAPEKIVVDREGLFLRDDLGKHFQIPLISVSQQGCYTIIPFLENISASVYPVMQCKRCKTPFNPNFFNKGICPKCGFQN